MFVVEVGSLLTTGLWLHDVILAPPGAQPPWFTGAVSAWLWFTVLFSTFAEAVAKDAGRPRRRRCAACGGRQAPGGSETEAKR